MTMSIISQQEVNSMASLMYINNNQILATFYELMTKRRRIDSTNVSSNVEQNYQSLLQQRELLVSIMASQGIYLPTSSSSSATSTITSILLPIINSQRTHRRKLKVVGRRSIANTTIATTITANSSRRVARDDLSIDDLIKPMEHLSIDCPLSRSTTTSTNDMPLELRKQSLDGLVDRMARLDIKDDGAEDDGDIIMTQASTLLEEPVYHFGTGEQQGSSFRNLVELTPTQKLRLHRQRRQEFMKKRINKHTLKISREN